MVSTSGSLEITENGVFDVTVKETVSVIIPPAIMVQTVAELPDGVPEGSMAIVLGGS